jgi:hypothetical protein
MATTAVCNSAKVEMMQGGHCFNATSTQSGTTHTNTTLDGLTSTANLAVGMAVSGTGIPAGAVIAAITSATAVTLSLAATNAATNTMTFTGDVFKLLLIKASPTRTFDGTQTNVGTPGTGTPSATNVGTDEASGTGYTSGGVALTNVGPSLPGNPTTTATITFSPDPSWASASFSTTACIIYNSSTRLGAAASPLNGRAVSVHDFGGTQTVTAGTFTVHMPTNDGSNAILRLA